MNSKFALKNLIFFIEIPIHPEFDDQANDQVNKLTKEQIEVLKYCKPARSNKDIQVEALKLKVHTDNFKRYIEPLIQDGLLERTIPDKHMSPNQEYIITKQGLRVLNLINQKSHGRFSNYIFRIKVS